ncbi:MOSC domain-containing protein [Cohaesibacter sp. CAU 1516]|uniref:MOSC domain-containing protein n=1 Tax=Cohaesibacter sp. CAU 1516 TaxID=2576038 RepID=UPI0010FF143B|nr:MOSC domain-containing protein [Cohaesibacter sp. CAU 1516]TLP44124.1 MOSC domain-containing protein [Cohaesibacter sp. CAU 1516]
MTPLLESTIEGLFLGAVQTLWDGRAPSAIAKVRATGRREIGPTGFIDDAQADLAVHGGADKAIHHYAFDHYASWIGESAVPPETSAGAFGENISTVGMTEDTLCIGDILQLGTAVVQISQGRQPCWKLNMHTGNRQMAFLFQTTGRTGWYYRVLETGSAGVGDSITLIERPEPKWSVKFVTDARLKRTVNKDDAGHLAELSVLADGWRKAFAKMATGNRQEDTRTRLEG